MNRDLYYTAPPKEIFEDIKQAAIKIWESYGHGHEKIKQIEDMGNVKDNWMYIIAMFDSTNRDRLFSMVNSETYARITEALR